MTDFTPDAHPAENGSIAENAAPTREAMSLRRFRLALAGLALLCSVLFFFRLGSVPLFDLDEALYVTCARNMARSGDIVTPRLNTRPLNPPGATTAPFYEKPILVYWASAASMRAFGANEWAARLPVALAGLLTTLVVVIAGARWFGRRAGLLAGLVYATAPLTILDARQMTTDGLLVTWLTLALVAFAKNSEEAALTDENRMLAKTGASPARPGAINRSPYPLIFWLCCALAVLTKGVVGLLLPLLVIGITLIANRLELRLKRGRVRTLAFLASLRLNPTALWLPIVRGLRPFVGLLIVLLLAAPWHLAIWKTGERDPLGRTWVQEYIIRQHIGRFKGLDQVHNAPIFTYVGYFLIGFFPWACFAPFALKRTEESREDRERKKEAMPGDGSGATPDRSGAVQNSPLHVLRGSSPFPERFLRVWFWTIFLFFSFGAAKLPTYIAPIYPPAALLVGRWLSRVWDEAGRDTARQLRRGAWGAVVTAGLLFAVALVGPRFTPANNPLPADVVNAIRHVTGWLFAGCLAALACFRYGRGATARRNGFVVLALTMTGLVLLGCTEGYAVATRLVLSTYQSLAEDARRDAKSGIPVVFYNIVPRRPSMLFYADDYAPYEFGAPRGHEPAPLLPFARPFLAGSPGGVDVITSREIWRTVLAPECKAGGVAADELRRTGTQRGGWILLRLRQAHVAKK